MGRRFQGPGPRHSPKPIEEVACSLSFRTFRWYGFDANTLAQVYSTRVEPGPARTTQFGRTSPNWVSSHLSSLNARTAVLFPAVARSRRMETRSNLRLAQRLFPAPRRIEAKGTAPPMPSLPHNRSYDKNDQAGRAIRLLRPAAPRSPRS